MAEYQTYTSSAEGYYIFRENLINTKKDNNPNWLKPEDEVGRKPVVRKNRTTGIKGNRW